MSDADKSVKSSDPESDGGKWTTVQKRGSKGPRPYKYKEAKNLERRLKIQHLANTLRGSVVSALVQKGWTYEGIYRSDDEASLPPPTVGYVRKYIPIDGNRWGDAVVFHSEDVEDPEEEAAVPEEEVAVPEEEVAAPEEEAAILEEEAAAPEWSGWNYGENRGGGWDSSSAPDANMNTAAPEEEAAVSEWSGWDYGENRGGSWDISSVPDANIFTSETSEKPAPKSLAPLNSNLPELPILSDLLEMMNSPK